MGTNAIDKGFIADAVAANVQAVRARRGLTRVQLCERLGELGRPLAESGLAKIEAKSRRVDVDDLVALALALNVSPTRLLLPDVGLDEEVELTPTVRAPAWAAWAWAAGEEPVFSEDDDLRDEGVRVRRREYLAERPAWLLDREEHPLAQAAQRVRWAAGKVVDAVLAGSSANVRKRGVTTWGERVDDALDGVRSQLDDVRAG